MLERPTMQWPIFLRRVREHEPLRASSRRRKQLSRVGAVLAVVLGVMGLTPTVASAAEPNTIDVSISDFEDGVPWRFGNGPEFPGAVGSHTIDPLAHTGTSSGRLQADFTAGGNYVQIVSSLNKDITELTWWSQTDEARAVTLRLVDSTGQTHQQRVALTAGDWQKLTVRDFNGGAGYAHYGGANDGAWHGPAQSMALLLNKSNLPASQKGAIRFDDVGAKITPPALDFIQAVSGNIFAHGETPAIDVQSQGQSVRWAVANSTGAVVDGGELTMTSATETLAWPDLPVGYYTLTATAVKDGVDIATKQTALALLVEHDQPSADSPFGMAVHLASWPNPGYGLVPLMAGAGASHAREDAAWKYIEREPDVYTYDTYDGMASALDDAGVEWLPIAVYTNPHHDGNATPYTDAGRAAFAAYSVDLLDHYSDSVQSIEIYNEFNIGFGDRGDGPADSLAAYYFPLLKKSYEEIKASSPDTVVVGGVTSGVPLTWLRQLFELGGLEYMDVLSVHPYLFPSSPDGLGTILDDLNDLVREYNGGQTIPIWITEQGWVTGTHGRAVTEQQQADYIVQTHVRALASGVERFYWYDFMNDGINKAEPEQNFGVIRNHNDPLGAWTPKPSYVAYSTMTSQLADAVFEREEEVSDSASSFIFTKDGAPVRALWSSTGQTVSLTANGPVTVTDMNGTSQRLQPSQGIVDLTLSGSPVFVSGKIAAVSDATRLSLSAPEYATVGGSIPVTLAVDNTHTKGATIGTFVTGDQSVKVHVRPGKREQYTLDIPAGDRIGKRTITGELRQGAHVRSVVSANVTVRQPLQVSARHTLIGGADHVTVTVSSISDQLVAAGNLHWKIGNRSGVIPTEAVPAGGSTSIAIPLADFPAGTYESTFSIGIGDAPKATTDTRIVVTDPAKRVQVPHRTLAIDGVAGEVLDLPSLDLVADGVNVMTGYRGPSDLSGDIWSTWDEDNLYLSAVIVDDVHAQPNSGEQIWAGDSIQFAISQGTPGEGAKWYEAGMALTPAGPQVYRWMSAEGASGAMPNSNLMIVRDESSKTTTYEIAIPWSTIPPIDPDDRLLSLSYVINDNDGSGRRGYIQVGSGIGGAKDSKLFLSHGLLEPTP